MATSALPFITPEQYLEIEQCRRGVIGAVVVGGGYVQQESPVAELAAGYLR
jgi:hypothetical protein